MWYFEVNARDDYNIEFLFLTMIDQVLAIYHQNEHGFTDQLERNYEKVGIKLFDLDYFDEVMQKEKDKIKKDLYK